MPQLELDLQNPQVPATLAALVAAKTNISDFEPNVGFQWKKYDAPATLTPHEANAAIYEGVLEGRIKNLSPCEYYSVRAFYKDDSGKYYYSEWKSFDPYDFSFFEPTVHTYPIEDIGETYAKVRGYALAGSDDIINQGFQYWIIRQSDSAQKIAPSANEITTVAAEGQIMTATLEDLLSGTEYVVRSFVETSSGFKYGDEVEFKTNGTTGIEDVYYKESLVKIIGYYDLAGNRYDNPRHGFNIVVYSNGTTKKIIINRLSIRN